MATTKATLAEQIMRILAGGDLKPDRNIDIREVMMYLDQTRDDLVVQSLRTNIKNGEYDIDPSWLSYYPSVAVGEDTATGKKCVTIPASRLSLPKDMGLYQVSTIDQDSIFIPVRAGNQWMFKNSGVFNVDDNTYYYPVANKIIFINLDDEVSTVLIILAASSKDIAEDAIFPINPDYEKMIIDTVLERFGVAKQIPHDEIEDGNK